MEVATLTATLKAEVAAFQANLRAADKAITGLQAAIKDLEKSAAGIQAALERVKIPASAVAANAAAVAAEKSQLKDLENQANDTARAMGRAYASAAPLGAVFTGTRYQTGRGFGRGFIQPQYAGGMGPQTAYQAGIPRWRMMGTNEGAQSAIASLLINRSKPDQAAMSYLRSIGYRVDAGGNIVGGPARNILPGGDALLPGIEKGREGPGLGSMLLAAGFGGGAGLRFGRFFGGFGFGRGFGFGGFRIPTAKMGSLGGLLGFGTERVLASLLGIGGSMTGGLLGGGLLGLGALGTSAVGIGTDLAGIGQAAGDIKTVSSDLGSLDAAILKYGKNSREAATAQAQLNADLQGFSPVARNAVLAAAQTSQGFKAMFDKLTGPAEKIGAEILNQAMKVGEKFLPTIGKFAAQNMSIIQRGLQPFFSWLQKTGPNGGLGIFTDLEKIFQKNLPTAVHAFTQFMELLLRTIDLAAHRLGGFTKAIDGFFTRMNGPDWNKWSTGVNHLIDLFFTWSRLFKSLVGLTYDVFKPAVGLGSDFAKQLTSIINQIRAWLHLTSTQGVLHSLFSAHLKELNAIFAVIKSLLPAIEELLGAFMQISAVVTQFATKILQSLADIINQIMKIPFAPQIIGWGAAFFGLYKINHILMTLLLGFPGVSRIIGAAFGTLGAEGTAAFGSIGAAATAALGPIAAIAAAIGIFAFSLDKIFTSPVKNLGKGPGGNQYVEVQGKRYTVNPTGRGGFALLPAVPGVGPGLPPSLPHGVSGGTSVGSNTGASDAGVRARSKALSQAAAYRKMFDKLFGTPHGGTTGVPSLSAFTSQGSTLANLVGPGLAASLSNAEGAAANGSTPSLQRLLSTEQKVLAALNAQSFTGKKLVEQARQRAILEKEIAATQKKLAEARVNIIAARILGIPGSGLVQPATVESLRLRERRMLQPYLERAGLGTGSHMSLQRIVDALSKNGFFPKTTLDSLNKINEVLNLHGKLQSQILTDIRDRLTQINDTLKGVGGYGTNYVPMSPESIAKGVKGLSPAARIALEQVLAQAQAHHFMHPSAPAAAGLALAPGGAPYPYAGSVLRQRAHTTGGHGRYYTPGAHTGGQPPLHHSGPHHGLGAEMMPLFLTGDIILHLNGKEVARVTRDELIKTQRRNATQTRGPNAGRNVGLN